MNESKQKRLQIFFSRLFNAKPVDTTEKVFQLLTHILNEVENEFTKIPFAPSLWMTDGRMYAPQTDSIRSTGNENIIRYRNRSHNTYIGNNGSIKIITVKDRIVLLDKPGLDGKKVEDL
ncbi:MAG: hypothetical protein ABUK01_09670 [Leptospirales bacterium]